MTEGRRAPAGPELEPAAAVRVEVKEAEQGGSNREQAASASDGAPALSEVEGGGPSREG